MRLGSARCVAVVAALLWGGVANAASSSAASAASAPASAASAAAPRNLVDVMAMAGTSESLMRTAHEHLPSEHALAESARAVDRAREILEAAGLDRVDGGSGLVGLLDTSHHAWALGGEVALVVRDLNALAKRLEHDVNALTHEADTWRDSVPLLERAQVPLAVLDRSRLYAERLDAAAARSRAARDQVLLGLLDAQAVQHRIDLTTASAARRIEEVRRQREQSDGLPIWRLNGAAANAAFTGPGPQDAQGALRAYLQREGTSLAFVFFAVTALCLWLFTRPAPPGTSTAQRAYGHPVPAAVLIALMTLWWRTATPPVMFYTALLAFVPIPAALVAARSFGAPAPLTMWGLALGTTLMALRNVIEAGALVDRVLLLVQVSLVGGSVWLDHRAGRLEKVLHWWTPRAVRALAWIIIVASLASLVHAVVGLEGPTRILRIAFGSLLGFGLVFGTTALTLYGAVLALMRMPLLGWLRSARQADPTLLRTLRWLLGTLAVIGTIVVTLGNLNLVPALMSAMTSFSDSDVDIGVITISAGDLGTALAVALATVLLTVVVDFLLVREVFPRLGLRPGAGYAVATLTRWTIGIVGGVLTLAALGVDTTKITVIAGALGVGIGFGLQNVVNNFVSGLILIVERPVAVGDLVEIGSLFGEIKSIGIRSSSVRTTHGADVIVPNSDLVSKEVVNWTRSDRQRRYDIDVGVAYGSDPAQVMRLLEEAAREVPEVMSEPAPRAMFRGFGDSSLDFRLLAWVTTIDLGVQAQNALRIAVLRKLGEAGIEMPFPQRDLHLPSAIEVRLQAAQG